MRKTAKKNYSLLKVVEIVGRRLFCPMSMPVMEKSMPSVPWYTEIND
jgi:hypothetical protein